MSEFAAICAEILEEQSIPLQGNFRKLFRDWSVSGGHPDKGGSPEVFGVVNDCLTKMAQSKDFADAVSYMSKAHVDSEIHMLMVKVAFLFASLVFKVVTASIVQKVVLSGLYYISVFVRFVLVAAITFVWKSTSMVLGWLKRLGITLSDAVLGQLHELRLKIWGNATPLTKKEYRKVEDKIYNRVIVPDLEEVRKSSPVDEVMDAVEPKGPRQMSRYNPASPYWELSGKRNNYYSQPSPRQRRTTTRTRTRRRR